MGMDEERGKVSRGPQNTRVYAPTHPRRKKEEQLKSAKEATGKNSKDSMQRREQDEKKSYVYVTDKQWRAMTQDSRERERPREKAEKLPENKQKKEPLSRKNAEVGLKHKERGGRKQTKEERGKGTETRFQQKNATPQEKRYGGVHRLEAVDEVFFAKREPEQKEKQKAQKQKKEPISVKKLLTFLIAAVLFIGSLCAGYFLFLLENIVVEGASKYAPEKIVELSGLSPGSHMLLADTGQAKIKIEEDPYLQVVNIEKEFPRTIRISIYERQEVAAIVSQGFYGIIDVEGHVLSIGSGGDLSKLIRVAGMSQHGFQINQSIGATDDVQTSALKALLKELDALMLISDITEINISNPLRVTLHTVEGITVLLGQADNLTEKLSWMKDTLPSLRAANIKEGMLDISAKGGPIYSPAEEAQRQSGEAEEGNEEGETAGNTGQGQVPESGSGGQGSEAPEDLPEESPLP